MKEVTRSITVDLARRGNVRLIFAKQNDENSRRLHISLTDDGTPYPIASSAQVLISYKRPDQTVGTGEATVLEDGSVEVTLSLWALSITGEVKCSLLIFDGDTRLSSDEFTLDVSESFYNGEEITPQAYSLLTSHMNKMNDILSAEEERVVAENERVSAEEARNNAEQTRENADNERKEEFEALSSQISEKLNEFGDTLTTISDNEAQRIVSEEQRRITENERCLAEEARVSAEESRSNAEALRSSAEQARAAAELERQEIFTQYGKADGVTISDADAHYASSTVEGALGEIGTALDSLNKSTSEAKQTASNSLGTKGQITIQASAWSEDIVATVSIDGVTDHDMVSLFPSSQSDKNTIEEIELFASPETSEGNILFSAKYKPSNNIALCYFISRGKEN